MSIASGAGTRVAYVAEATWGTTPATPVFQIMRVTNAGLTTNKTTGTSDELRRDRNVPDEFELGQDVAGNYDFELSYGSLDALIAAALMSSWSTDVIVNGATPASVTFEELLETGATDNYARFRGGMVNTLSLDIRARQAITGSLGIMARDETLATAIISGATYTAANGNMVATASGSVGALTIGSISPAPKVMRLSLQISNNLRTRPVVGSKYSEVFGLGRCDVTGEMEVYFETADAYQAMLDHDTIAIEATIGVVTGEKYTITIPKAVLTGGRRGPRSNQSDVMLTIPFRAIYDSGIAGSIQIERAVA
jgi:hypothetical protein